MNRKQQAQGEAMQTVTANDILTMIPTAEPAPVAEASVAVPDAVNALCHTWDWDEMREFFNDAGAKFDSDNEEDAALVRDIKNSLKTIGNKITAHIKDHG